LGEALTDGILLVANEAVRRKLERQMLRQGFRSEFLRKQVAKAKRQGKAEGKREGKAEGKAEGKREGEREGRVLGTVETLRAAVYEVLKTRGFALSDALRTRVDSEPDTTRLARWHAAAVTAPSLAEVFIDD
jgi:flagellar biosynthesis/type III secretory pathway protein FliH